MAYLEIFCVIYKYLRNFSNLCIYYQALKLMFVVWLRLRLAEIALSYIFVKKGVSLVSVVLWVCLVRPGQQLIIFVQIFLILTGWGMWGGLLIVPDT